MVRVREGRIVLFLVSFYVIVIFVFEVYGFYVVIIIFKLLGMGWGI